LKEVYFGSYVDTIACQDVPTIVKDPMEFFNPTFPTTYEEMEHYENSKISIHVFEF
jgi:hypothetical protein